MRIWPINLLLCGALSIPACAASIKTGTAEEDNLASLEQRAAQAPTKSQCYEYAQLVHEMVEYSARQFAAGNSEKASGMLKRSQDVARKIRALLAADPKKLKEAEILLRRTAFRLNDVLHAGGCDDPALVQETLAQLNQAESDLMLRVFQR